MAIDKADECLLVEGYTDVMSLHQAGVENAVASGGTSLTADQLRLIKKIHKQPYDRLRWRCRRHKGGAAWTGDGFGRKPECKNWY